VTGEAGRNLLIDSFPLFHFISFQIIIPNSFRHNIMPPYAPRFKKRNAKAKRPAKRANRKPGKPSKALTKAVQSIIHKQAETKMAYHAIDNVGFNSGINALGDMQRVLPNIAIGTADNERIGEQCRLMSLRLKGHLYLSTANNSVSNARIGVRMFVVQPKNLSGYPDASATTAWLSKLLRKGGTNTAFTGIISDLYAPVNTDAITCHYDKVTYVTMPFIFNQSLGVPTTGYTSTAWDMVNSTKFFNINLKVKNKLLKYDKDYSTTQPTSYTPILVVGYVHLDSSSPDVVTTQVYVSYDSIVTYEDM